MTADPWDIADAAAALRAGHTTSAELVERALSAADRLDPVLGVHLARFDDEARDAARLADEIRSRGIDLGPLHGVPLAVKDMLTSWRARRPRNPWFPTAMRPPPMPPRSRPCAARVR